MTKYQIANRRFGYIKAISNLGRGKWLCQCDCGKKFSRGVWEIMNREMPSCGCKKAEQIGKRASTHGMSNTITYRSWVNMKARCLNSSDTGYLGYGGRGIYICKRWLDSFPNFYADMGDRPSKHHSIERINNNSGYTPSNCRWATQKDQLRNTRRTRIYTFNGKTMCLTDWGKSLGLTPYAMYSRIKRGWPTLRAFTQQRKTRPAK